MKVAMLTISALLIGASTAAFGQQKVQQFAPFTVTPQEYAALQRYLSGKPYATVAPVIGFLENKEKSAQTQAHVVEMKAKTPKPNVAPPKDK